MRVRCTIRKVEKEARLTAQMEEARSVRRVSPLQVKFVSRDAEKNP